MNDEPLIYTIRGNLPVASLAFEVKWRVEPDFVSMTEIYTAEDGVIVRQDSHVCALKGATLQSTPAEL
jgi:hypothetical protein